MSDEARPPDRAPERTYLREADGSFAEIPVDDGLADAPGESFDAAGAVEPLEAALVREDGALLYPIRDGIPVLLADEGIATA